MAVVERLCESSSVPRARRDLALEKSDADDGGAWASLGGCIFLVAPSVSCVQPTNALARTFIFCILAPILEVLQLLPSE